MRIISILVLISMMTSSSAFATEVARGETCLTKYQKMKDSIKNVLFDGEATNTQAGIATGTAAGASISFAIVLGTEGALVPGALVGIGLVLGVAEADKQIKRRSVQKMISLIEESYLHKLNPEADRHFLDKIYKRLHKKNPELSRSQVADSFISANEDLNMCADNSQRFSDIKEKAGKGTLLIDLKKL